MKFIFSDLHGCIYTFEKLLEKIRVLDSNPEFIFNGDYVDRGLFSKQTVDLLLTLNNSTFLRGNHDDIIDYLLNEHCYTELKEMIYGKVSTAGVFTWWLQNGLASCLSSYDVNIYTTPIDKAVDLFKEKVPDSHKIFFRKLGMFWENETHFCCHAYYNPNEELPRDIVKFTKQEKYHDCLWSRFERDYSTKSLKNITCKWDKIGVFGHTPVSYYGASAPVVHDKIRLIDTGSFLGEYLCAYCVDTDDHVLQSVDSRDVDAKYRR